jgi:stalled ribosome rescue protein Dom34
MEVHLGTLTANLWKDAPELRKRVGREWTKHHFQDHRKARTDQFFKDVVRTLEHSMASGGYKHIILAGTPDVTARVRRLLPKHLEERVLDSIVANQKDNANDVVAATLATFIEEEQRESMTRVEAVQRELRSRGLAAIGLQDTRRALEYGQVDVLVLARELDPEIKEPLVRLAERTSCEVETVEANHWLMENEGVGALLRYWSPEVSRTKDSGDPIEEGEGFVGRRRA